MRDIKPILHSLGLLESEIKTYLGSLEMGPGTVLELAKKTTLSRQATYTAIEALTARGLMSSALHGKRRMYAAEHPEKLLAYAKRRELEMKDRIQDLERIVPELELQVGGEKPVVKVFEGKEGVKIEMEDVIASKPKIIHEIADLDAVNAVLATEDKEFVAREIAKQKIAIQGIYAGEPSGKQEISGRERLFLSDALTGTKANIAIYGNKVAMMTYEGKMFTVLIESPAIAQVMRVMFSMAFKSVKTEKK